MSDRTRKNEAQVREKPEPYESNFPIPRIVLILVAGVVLWAAGYIVFTHQTLPPELGDRRIAADFAVASAPGGKVDGAQVYTAQCLACHQATGAGVPGVFPPLAGSEWVLGKPSGVIQIVLHGITGKLTVHGVEYNGEMPTFKDKLDDAEIAAVINHVRTSFGNEAEPVDAEMVRAEREATKDRTEPWNGDEDLAQFEK